MESYPLLGAEPIARRARSDCERGVLRFSVVTSGRTLSEGETDADAYLTKLCARGFAKRYGDRPEVRKRLDYELNMIRRMGFVDYFLIVSDFIGYAKAQHIPVGPGRGSAAGSVVSYCLGITDVDPVQYNLYFERFLNPERVSMPDIDVDFCVNRRGEVIDLSLIHI